MQLLLPAASFGIAAPRLAPPLFATYLARAPLVAMGEDSLILTEENAVAVLDNCQKELATVFGNNPESLRVGITGGVEFVELDGPTMVVRFTGRFWHARVTVLDRIEAYVLARIPECIGVDIEDDSQLDDADPEAPSAYGEEK